MSCSYDPVPYEYYPSPTELWMKENQFSHIKDGISYCHSCGLVLAGQQHGRRFLTLHLSICPSNPREEILEKTLEECKLHKETRWN